MRIDWRMLVAISLAAASMGVPSLAQKPLAGDTAPSSHEAAARLHERGVEYHLQRRLDEAAREYDRALALDPPRVPATAERAIVLRFAPRVYTTPDEPFPLKDAAAVLHPSERLIAYHFFWEDDIDFPEDNDPCDHEVVWIQFSPDRQSIERFWTYFHGRILEAGEDALRDARRHEMRARVNVQWGKHGSMPLGWESMTIVGDTGDLERAYYSVGKPITLAEYNRGTWQKLRKEGRRLIDHPMAKRLAWPARFAGEWDRFVDFSRDVSFHEVMNKRGFITVSHWNSAAISRQFLAYNFRPKTEWPGEPPGAGALMAQQAPSPSPYVVGNPLGLPITPNPAGTFNPISPNVKVFGSIYAAESCSYDPGRNLIVVPSRGAPQNVQTNNAWISLVNHDGSVHTARWIGVQNPGNQRSSSTPLLVLNEPFGSDIVNGMLYVADLDGGTGPSDPSVAVIRRFDMKTGQPAGEIRVEQSTGLNDIAVSSDGTIYATQTGAFGESPDPTTWRVWKISAKGTASVFVQGALVKQPNGIALDPQGNIVVVTVGNADVLTFAPDGTLLQTETAVQAGNDGLVIMKDGTKYVSSVVNGGVSRIRPKQAAELIAQNIPTGASMCYDAGANQLVIPMNANNALAFVPLK